jgi:hypothetical protein
VLGDVIVRVPEQKWEVPRSAETEELQRAGSERK